MKNRRKTKYELAVEEADLFNQRHAPGTPVLYRLGLNTVNPLESVTRGEAWALPCGEAVVRVKGRTGGVALSHIDVIPHHRENVLITPFSPALHLEQTLNVLERVRQADPMYQSRRTGAGTRRSLEHWLAGENRMIRLTALVNDTVAGHVLVTRANSYLSDFLARSGHPETDREVVEIGKLFVDPAQQRLGLGTALLAAASRIVRHIDCRPVLVVPEAAAGARRLCRSAGITELGTFQETGGISHVFLDDQNPAAGGTNPDACGSNPRPLESKVPA